MENIFLAAIQSSFFLGLLHGINPCGHSWLVLLPFVSGENKGRRVAVLTLMFLGGTVLACLAVGASLGAVSHLLPKIVGVWVEKLTSLILLGIGMVLIVHPRLLHCHDDEECHDGHACTCGGHNQSWLDRLKNTGRGAKMLSLSLFGIGFINMIIPCPTVAVMYSYAINSGNWINAMLVFGIYALSTAMAVSAVIYMIFRTSLLVQNLQKVWVESLIMRLIGSVVVVFSLLALLNS